MWLHLAVLLLCPSVAGFSARPLACRSCRARAGPAPTMAARTVTLGIVGGGTVGGGIVEILGGKAAQLEALGLDIKISKVCVRDPSKPRDFKLPSGCAVVGDAKAILDDPEVDIVVEVMGGTGLAKTIVESALEKGKHVVTANKALIAQELPALEDLLSRVNKGRDDDPVRFGYEAAVCGGIPIIHALQRDFLGDDIVQLNGIINGATNFILTNMEQGGKSYSDALAEASELGYAEADPTLDVMGFDACLP